MSLNRSLNRGNIETEVIDDVKVCTFCTICNERVEQPKWREHLISHNPNADNMDFEEIQTFFKIETEVKETISDLLDKYPKLYDYDYKWKDSKNYKDLNEILEVIGYKLVDDEVKAGDYNDIKGYFGCEIEKL